MESKYYTPKLEEFHVGFECETNYCLFHSSRKDHGEFEKLIITEDNIVLLLDSYIGDAHPNEFRTKYLDKQDIEELGFTHKLLMDNNNPYNYNWFERVVDDGISTVEITHYYQDNTIRIKTYVAKFKGEPGELNGFHCTPLFLGTIKNKSELKELLEKLGIL